MSNNIIIQYLFPERNDCKQTTSFSKYLTDFYLSALGYITYTETDNKDK